MERVAIEALQGSRYVIMDGDTIVYIMDRDAAGEWHLRDMAKNVIAHSQYRYDLLAYVGVR